ncbi:hypothetical protein GCM10027570_42320 [Streptomonospora sediminis]
MPGTARAAPLDAWAVYGSVFMLVARTFLTLAAGCDKAQCRSAGRLAGAQRRALAGLCATCYR